MTHIRGGGGGGVDKITLLNICRHLTHMILFVLCFISCMFLSTISNFGGDE